MRKRANMTSQGTPVVENSWIRVDESNLFGAIIVWDQSSISAVELHQHLDHNKLLEHMIKE
jgi:hypothetical protein